MIIESKKQIIFFELNEVPSIIFERYGKKSKSFSKLLSKFSRYQTVSKDDVHLSPWITWPTVHRGVTFKNHKIENLGQDISKANKLYPPIWETLKNLNLSVGVYGSLHSSYLKDNLSDYSFYMPDIFSSHNFCHPKTLQPIQNFQLKLSRKSARNVDKSIGGFSALKIILLLLKNGLTLLTSIKIIKQLLNEKLSKEKLSRRRILQADINFDIFANLLEKNNPNFSTFFSNHVASSMHRYWEASYPFDYKKQIQSSDWLKKYRGEVNYSMKSTEKIIKDLVKYAQKRRNCEVWICTSMGQKPVENYESISSQLILDDIEKFLYFLNLDPKKYKIKPTMMPRFTLEAKNKLDLLLLEESINKLKLNNKNIEQMVLGNTLTIRIMHWNTSPKFTYNNQKIQKEDIGMKMIEIKDNTGTSAYHIPEGCLYIFGKDSSRYLNKGIISTDEIKNLITSTFKKNK